ncbi:eukaryotic initiation factor 3 gamma subunit family protein [Zea mays]|uniref:tRNA (adenine(58)-N(1))-methyltransferase non-catalytic subunit TRM6 n=1 Tax=Zea mays TaxID=4577 RepID=A0A1D6G514_MAIZE|nr:eukaryotic initiation factor 3 gamma subunit family protein [Zea mays]
MCSICETYFKKSPAHIGFVRVDTLSLLLPMVNISAYSDVLVVDMVGGLVVGAVAEHLGGTGYVCSTCLGSAPSTIDIIRMYNLSSDMVSRYFSFGTRSVALKGRETIEPAGDEDAHASLAHQVGTAVSDDKAQLSTDQPTDMEASEPSLDEHHVQDENSSLGGKDSDGTTSNASKSPKPGKAPSPEKMKYWKEHGFSSLIVAAPGHEVECLVADLLPLLSYSAPFAIYHQYPEFLISMSIYICTQPLAKCMYSLQLSKRAIGLQLSEPCLREYQVST